MAGNILLKITADRQQAKAELDAQSAQLDALDRKSVTVAIRADAEQAKRDIKEVIAESKLIPREETIRIRVAADQAKLQQLQARMQGLEQALRNAAAEGGATDGIIVRMGAVARQIDTVKNRIESAGQEFENLAKHADSFGVRAAGAFARTSGALSSLLSHIPLLGGLLSGIAHVAEAVGNKLKTVFSDASGGFSFRGVLTSIMQGLQKLGQVAINIPAIFSSILGAGLSLAAIGPIVLAIAAAFAALVVSLGMALIGIVALGVAFLAALAPIALLIGAIVIKLKNAYTAQQNLKQATTDYANAVAAQKQATDNLAQAEHNQSQQRLAALQAEKDAVLAVKDAENQVADARLNIKSSALGVQQAKLALAQFKAQLAGFGTNPADLEKKAANVDVSGNFGQTQAGASSTAWQSMLLQYKQLVLGVAQAQQQNKDAIQAAADATNNLGKAEQTQAQFAKNGLQGYQGYYDAIQQVRQAVSALAGANRQLSLAAYNLHRDTRQVAASDGILGVFDRLKTTLGHIFGPAVQAAFKGLGQALKILAEGLKPLTPVFTQLGGAFGQALVQIAKAVTSPTGIKELGSFIRETAKFIPALTQFFIGVGGLLMAVANAALPRLDNGLTGIGKKFIDVAKHPQDIATYINKCIDQTKIWFHWIGVFLGGIVKIGRFFTGTLIPIFKNIGSVIKEFMVTPLGWALDKIAKVWGILQQIHAAEAAGAALAAGNKAPEGALLQRMVAQKNISGVQGLLSSQIASLRGGGLSGKELGLELQQVKAELQALVKLGVKLPAGLSINDILKSLAAQSALGGNVVIPGMAAGGLVASPMMAMVGEAGPEAVIPLQSGVLQQLGQMIARFVVPDFTALTRMAQPAAAGGVSPAAMGDVHHHHWHLNQGDTIASPEHFSAVVSARLRSKGLGRRGA